jgi:hypothetical protein
MPTRSRRKTKFQLSPDHIALLSALNDHDVKYLLVGGYAVGIHSEPRATKTSTYTSARTNKTAKPFFALWPASALLLQV